MDNFKNIFSVAVAVFPVLSSHLQLVPCWTVREHDPHSREFYRTGCSRDSGFGKTTFAESTACARLCAERFTSIVPFSPKATP